jgi:pSer/pThr/pTyr-binding forkhead associated (FHA) protein
MSLEVNGELIPVGGGDPIPLIRETMTMGRRESCDIIMRYPNVSGTHAQLMFHDGCWFVQDLNSTNGVKVNGSRIHQRKLLHRGDEITIAKRRYTIEYEEAVNRRMEELFEEEDVMAQSLLERAGLAHPARQREEYRKDEDDAGEFLLQDDQEPPPSR